MISPNFGIKVNAFSQLASISCFVIILAFNYFAILKPPIISEEWRRPSFQGAGCVILFIIFNSKLRQ